MQFCSELERVKAEILVWNSNTLEVGSRKVDEKHNGRAGERQNVNATSSESFPPLMFADSPSSYSISSRRGLDSFLKSKNNTGCHLEAMQ
jgi:hypothetical protein